MISQKDKMHITRAAAMTIVGMLALSCSACGLIPESAKPEDIVDAADAFASAMVKCDAGKIAKLTTEDKDSDTIAELEAHLGGLLYTAEQDTVAEAVADTITYEVDEDSVEIDKEEAEAEVIFTMVDYDKALGGIEFFSVDEAVQAVKDCDDTIEVKLTLEFEKDEDEWLVSNFSDKGFMAFYDFCGYDINFIPDFVSFIDHTDIYASDILIFMSVVFTEDFSDYADGMSMDVYLNDAPAENGGTYVEGDLETIWCEFATNADYLETGTYTVVLRYGDYEIASETTIVDNTWTETISGGEGSGGALTTIEGDTYIATIDCVNIFNLSMADEMGYDDGFTGELPLDIILVLGDGQYELTIDAEKYVGDLSGFMEENIDTLLYAEFGTSDPDELDELATVYGVSSYQELKETTLDMLVDYYDAEAVTVYDTGTYTIDGDTIYFESADYGSFDATIGADGSISMNSESDPSLAELGTVEFYLQ